MLPPASEMTLRELLSRIRWDRGFGQGKFAIGYDDHAGGIVRVPLEQVGFEEGNHFSFQVRDASGEVLAIPFHRVREVLKDGVIFWIRPPHGPGGGHHPA